MYGVHVILLRLNNVNTSSVERKQPGHIRVFAEETAYPCSSCTGSSQSTLRSSTLQHLPELQEYHKINAAVAAVSDTKRHLGPFL